MNDASPFDDRFELLRDSGQAGEQVIGLTRRVVRDVERDFGLTLNEGNGAMFVTHLALALQRLSDGVPLEAPPPAVLNEARALKSEWDYAQTLATSLSRALNRQLPEGEIGYLTLHLARLKQEASE